MISEIEKRIGICERVFDLAKARLEKIVFAVEDETDLHGAPSQKLVHDLATATVDFSVTISELNTAYALRVSKQSAVPPAENYLELFRKNAAAKREAWDAARREEAEAAAKETYDAALRANTRPIAPVAPRRFEPEPLPRPTNTSLQDVIDEIESRINRMTAEIRVLEKPGDSWHSWLKACAGEKKNETERTREDRFHSGDLLPPYEKKKKELEELRAEHRNLMTQRKCSQESGGEVRQKPLFSRSASR